MFFRPRRLATLIITIITVFSLFIPSFVQAQLGSVRISDGFTNPVYGASAPGSPGTLYVLEQAGLIRPLNLSTGVIGPTFLNLPSIVTVTTGGERGLLGLAFDPNYANNGRFYVNYTGANGALTVDRFTAIGGVVNTGSRQNIISIPHSTNSNHNGGWTHFGPDGLLYFATGDGGGANDQPNNAQNLNSLLGKMLRLDVSGAGAGYVVPPSNPFVGQGGTLPEIWAYGLRNPWRNSFDRTTGNLYIADVGQFAREEVNFQAAGIAGGQNYGWRPREGSQDNPDVGDPAPNPRVDPIYDYAHSGGGNLTGSSITGGFVYRGGDILEQGTSLDGTYFFGDYISQRIWSFRYNGSGILSGGDITVRTAQLQNAINGGSIERISSFAEDGLGRLYVIDHGTTPGTGEVFRISAVPEPTVWIAAGALIVTALAGYRFRRRQLLSRSVEE